MAAQPTPAPGSPAARSGLRWIAGLVVAVLAALGYVQLDGPAEPRDPPGATGAPPAAAPDLAGRSPAAARSLVVRGPAGPTDLGPTLLRIERGERFDHRNDGAEFQNRERRLPQRPRGHYREYVHPTPGERGPGAQRIVVGRDGEVWYTPDHYESFRRVEWAFAGGVPR